MAVIQVIDGRERDLGGFVVRRILPSETQPMVGPFIFFDHLGPVQLPSGHGIDVRPHPHIGLATVTFLFVGELEHRDSLGNVRTIRPGDVNWMTAGHGIVHSERSTQESRVAGAHIHGIQSWVALPDGSEDVDPEFTHHPVPSLPRVEQDGVELTVIAGRAFGVESLVATAWPTLYVHAQMADGALLDVPEYTEAAAYVVGGAVTIEAADGAAATHLVKGQMGVLSGSSRVRAAGAANIMLLGGERFPTPRHLFWNFVASSPARIEQAKRRWSDRAFPTVPLETEFIPLPT